MKSPALLSVLFLAACVAIATAYDAKVKTSAAQLSSTEKWIVEQVTAGEVADLTEEFPDENKRKVSAHFLEDLLTATIPGIKPHRKGVRITGAIIAEPLDLTNAQIPYEVWLEDCQFMGDVVFVGANFTGAVSFDDSTFRATANFNGMKVGSFATFEKTIFEGQADFTAAEIARSFKATEAQFKNEQEEASFNGMKVGSFTFFQKAFFQGAVDFGSADIGGEFNADGAQFKNEKEEANFNGMKVGSFASFDGAVFEGPVDFVFANIAAELKADRSQFRNREKAADFNGIKAGYASFDEAIFEGGVDFGFANITGEFSADKAQFKNKDQTADFSDLKVGNTVSFENAVFEGPVNFVSADIAGDFNADGAQFRNETETVELTIKCGGAGSFTSISFAGGVSFEDSSFVDLIIEYMRSGAEPIPELDLSHCSIKRQLSISRITIEALEATSLHVEGPADFTEIKVELVADLSYANFAALDLSSSVWPKDVEMQGMKYQHLRAAANESDSHRALVKLADQSAYAADVYGNLADFFSRQGYRTDGDNAFIAGKRRERKDYLHGFQWAGSLLLDWLVGYGRRPWQAGIPCALFLAIGCFLFSPGKMEPQKPDDAPRVYNRFWYSLDLFLPFVNLQADDAWKPKMNERFLRHYVRLHVMLGWVLIPIVLAALSGLIK